MYIQYGTGLYQRVCTVHNYLFTHEPPTRIASHRIASHRIASASVQYSTCSRARRVERRMCSTTLLRPPANQTSFTRRARVLDSPRASRRAASRRALTSRDAILNSRPRAHYPIPFHPIPFHPFHTLIFEDKFSIFTCTFCPHYANHPYCMHCPLNECMRCGRPAQRQYC